MAVWGVFAGAAAVLFLLKKRTPQEVSKNWHFYAKLVRETTGSLYEKLTFVPLRL